MPRYYLPEDAERLAADLDGKYVVVDVMARAGKPAEPVTPPKPVRPPVTQAVGTPVTPTPPAAPKPEQPLREMSDPDLDTLRRHMGLKRNQGESREALIERIERARKNQP